MQQDQVLLGKTPTLKILRLWVGKWSKAKSQNPKWGVISTTVPIVLYATELALTMMWPPPGVWWAFSREPTFAWALSLKSNFTVSMRTLPPPENRREEWQLHGRFWDQKKQKKWLNLPIMTRRYNMFEVRLPKSQTDFCLFIQHSIPLVKIPSWQQAVRPYELFFFWHLLA